MQSEDESLQKYWDRGHVLAKGGILYRIYKHPFANGGKPVKEVIVPVQLSHLSIKKTTDKIQSALYWPQTVKLAHTPLQKAQDKGKHYYDRKTRVTKFQPVEKVLVLLPTDYNTLLMQWKR